MTLCFDLGNTRLSATLFTSSHIDDSDNGAVDLSLDLTENPTPKELADQLSELLMGAGITPSLIGRTAFCSVVPSKNPLLIETCLGLFGSEPFQLTGENPPSMTVHVDHPSKVGADRIAAALGAMRRYPGENLIVVDMGTATTVDAVSAEGGFLGGTILPGLALSRDSLSKGTAQLPPIEILSEPETCGKNTEEAIQSGLYYSALGGVKEISSRLIEDCFGRRPARIIGTGGFAQLFSGERIFDAQHPRLVLEGVLVASKLL